MRPDDPLVRHYLAHSMVMRLATISARGAASITPLWFVLDGDWLIASTGAATVAARNVGYDRRVTLLLDGETAGRSELVLRLSGTAEVRRGLPPVRLMARLAAKYYVAPRGARSELLHARQWSLRSRYYAQSQAVVLAIKPEHAELVAVPAEDARLPDEVV
jgi:hypothetical protein